MIPIDPTGPGPAPTEPDVVTPGSGAGPDPVPVGSERADDTDLADLATRVIRLPPDDRVAAPEQVPAELELGGRPYRLAPHPAEDPAEDPAPPAAGPTRLVVVYDETCALCRRAHDWLRGQTTFIPLELLAAGSDEARHRYGSLPWLGEELVVVDQDGQAWIGPAAFLMAMWATHRYRHWSYRLSGPAFAPLAEQFFHRISNRRRHLGALLLGGGRSTGHPSAAHHRDSTAAACAHCARPGVRS